MFTKDSLPLEKAKFCVPKWDFNRHTVEPFNIFEDIRILLSVASFKTGLFDLLYPSEEERKEHWLRWCFGDTWGRVQYNLLISDPVPAEGDKPEEVHIFDCFIKPNEELLFALVESISTKSCEQWLEQHKIRTNRRRKKDNAKRN